MLITTTWEAGTRICVCLNPQYIAFLLHIFFFTNRMTCPKPTAIQIFRLPCTAIERLLGSLPSWWLCRQVDVARSPGEMGATAAASFPN